MGTFLTKKMYQFNFFWDCILIAYILNLYIFLEVAERILDS